MPSRNDFVEAARSYKGCKWRHQGRTRNGIDCAGVVVCSLRDVGLNFPDRTDYGRRTHGQEFLDHFEQHGIRKLPKDMHPGDVVVFREPAYPCHSAVVSMKHGVLHMVHAHARRKKVVEEPLDEFWMQFLVAAYAVPGLED